MSVAHTLKQWFFDNDIVSCRSNLEGQSCQDFQFIIGAKAGPSSSISNLLHEVCHFAEREPEKLARFPSFAWGFYQGKFWQIGTSWGHEPQTDQQVHREAKVWAMQLSLDRHFNVNDSAENLVSSATWLPAWCLYRKHFTRKCDDKKALYYLARHVDRLSKQYNVNKVLDEYNMRVNYLKHLIPTIRKTALSSV